MPATCACSWSVSERQLERGLGDVEVGVAGPPLVGGLAEERFVKGHAAFNVAHVERDVRLGDGRGDGVRHSTHGFKIPFVSSEDCFTGLC
jgi:hypothetical protein